MAQSGYTPILIYASGTATNVPLAANLTSTASGAELALNYADGKLYFKNSSGVVTLLASSATAGSVVTTFSAGTTGLTPNTATSGAITLAGTLGTANGGTNLTSFTSGGAVYATSTSALTTGTLPIVSGGTNSTATPTAGGAGYGTGTAHAYTAAGTSGQALISAGAAAPAFGNLALGVANTNVSGALTPTNGGTGVATLTGIAYGNGTSAFTAASTAQVLSVIGTVPIANGGTGITAFGTGVATALGVNVGSAGAFVTFNGALGAPSSGTVTNLTGTASININGTVGATTANTGAFTTLSASSTVSGTGFSTYLASPPAIGGTTAAAGSFTTLGATGVFTASAGTSALPSIVTSSGLTSGLYSSTANVLGIAISAASVGTFTATGLNGMAVGATTTSTGAFTTLSASSTVSGTGFSTYLASPPAIGGTAAAAGTFTTLQYATLQPIIATTTTGATITPDGTKAQYNVTALASATTIAAPSGTPTDGQKLIIRFKDNGTAWGLTWTVTSGAYRAVGVTLPTTTVPSKVLYVGCIYNAQDTFWDVVAVAEQ